MDLVAGRGLGKFQSAFLPVAQGDQGYASSALNGEFPDQIDSLCREVATKRAASSSSHHRSIGSLPALVPLSQAGFPAPQQGLCLAAREKQSSVDVTSGRGKM